MKQSQCPLNLILAVESESRRVHRLDSPPIASDAATAFFEVRLLIKHGIMLILKRLALTHAVEKSRSIYFTKMRE